MFNKIRGQYVAVNEAASSVKQSQNGKAEKACVKLALTSVAMAVLMALGNPVMADETYVNADSGVSGDFYGDGTVSPLIVSTDSLGQNVTNSDVYGRYQKIEESGNASANGMVVNYKSGSVKHLYAGCAVTGEGEATASNNTVNYEGGSLTELNVGRAEAASGEAYANSNKLNIRTSASSPYAISGPFYVGHAQADATYGSAYANENEASICAGGIVNSGIQISYIAYVQGISGTASANKNKLTISDEGTWVTDTVGTAISMSNGIARADSTSGVAQANENEFSISNGATVFGGGNAVSFGNSVFSAKGNSTLDAVTANRNKFTISGVATKVSSNSRVAVHMPGIYIQGSLQGNFARAYNISGDAQANGNEFSISDGAQVYGKEGAVYFNDFVVKAEGNSTSDAVTANRNKFEISGEGTQVSADNGAISVYLGSGGVFSNNISGGAHTDGNIFSVSDGAKVLGDENAISCGGFSVANGKTGTVSVNGNTFTIAGKNTEVTSINEAAVSFESFVNSLNDSGVAQADGNVFSVSNGAQVSGGSYGVSFSSFINAIGKSDIGVVTANNNRFTISGEDTKVSASAGDKATVYFNSGVMADNGQGSAQANGNVFSITDSSVKGLVNITGSSFIFANATGGAAGKYSEATGNFFTIQNSTEEVSLCIGDVVRAASSNKMAEAKASDNRFFIQNVSLKSDKKVTLATATSEVSAEACNNTLIVDGGTHTNVTLTAAYVQDMSDGGDATLKADNNMVMLLNGTFTDVTLYGACFVDNSRSPITRSATGNTLVIGTPVSAKTVSGFQTYLFAIPRTLLNSDTPMLSTPSATSLDSAAIAVSLANDVKLKEGDTTTLINVTSGTPSFDSNKAISLALLTDAEGNPYSVKNGDVSDFIKSDVTLAVNDSKLVATFTNVKANDNAKAVAEGQIANMALLTQGSDLVAGEVMQSALDSVVQAKKRKKKTTGGVGFGAVLGGYSRYDTSSQVKLSSFEFVAGYAQSVKAFSQSRLTVGGFLEAGYGDYDTLTNDVRGDGKSRYVGVGFLSRLGRSNDFGPYGECSFRLGRASNDWDGPRGMSTDLAGFYCGTHIGVGYRGDLRDGYVVDFYGKGFWTHQNGKDAIAKGAEFKFDDIDSLKTRIGVRVTSKEKSGFMPYIGLAWDREFTAKAKATVNGIAVDAPDLKGDTHSIEAGFTYQPVKKSNWKVTAKASGYTGVREGVTGHVLFENRF